MIRKRYATLFLLVFLISFNFVYAQGWLDGDDSTGTPTGDEVINDSDDLDIPQGDESTDAGLGWEDDGGSSSSSQSSSESYKSASNSGGFTGRFYLALVLGFIVIALIVFWVILLKRPIK